MRPRTTHADRHAKTALSRDRTSSQRCSCQVGLCTDLVTSGSTYLRRLRRPLSRTQSRTSQRRPSLSSRRSIPKASPLHHPRPRRRRHQKPPRRTTTPKRTSCPSSRLRSSSSRTSPCARMSSRGSSSRRTTHWRSTIDRHVRFRGRRTDILTMLMSRR